MIVAYEVLNEDTLPILEQLERLHLLRRVPETGENGEQNRPGSQISDRAQAREKLRQIVQNQKIEPVKAAQKPVIPLRKKSLAGSISSETMQKLREHIENIRNE